MQNGLAPSSSTNFPGSAPPAPCPCPLCIPVALDWPAGILRAGLWVGRLALGGCWRQGDLPDADTAVEQGPGFGEKLQLGLHVGFTPSQGESGPFSTAIQPCHWAHGTLSTPARGRHLEVCLLRTLQPQLPPLVRASHGQSWGGRSLKTAGLGCLPCWASPWQVVWRMFVCFLLCHLSIKVLNRN